MITFMLVFKSIISLKGIDWKKQYELLRALLKAFKKRLGDICVAFALVVIGACTQLIKKMHKPSFAVSVASVVLAFSVAVSSVAYATSFDVAVKVMCDGVCVGYVADFDAAEDIQNIVNETVIGDTNGIFELSFEEGFTPSKSILSSDEVVFNALESVDGLYRKAGLCVDGSITAVAESCEQLEGMLLELKNSYMTEGATFVGYENEVSIKEVYLTASAIETVVTDLEGFISGKTGVKVIITRVEDYDEEIPFTTNVTYDEGRVSGYTRVINKGKNGMSHVTADVTYVNGKSVSVGVITQEVIALPVAANVAEGMCNDAVTSFKENHSTGKVNGYDLLTFPCEVVETRTYFSSFWGDGRGHKGVDIASPKGSDIYAADSGTVVVSGWDGAYGKYVIIDHGNGMRTLYSHNEENLVKVGDKVAAGQKIATVGRTGNATGNHLHFSVLINGRQVDPSYYLGIKE